MNERYEEVKKYLCTHTPESTRAVCKSKIEGKIITKQMCLACMGQKFITTLDGLWKIVLTLGTKELGGGATEVLFKSLTKYEEAKSIYFELVKDMPFSHIESGRERFITRTEQFIEEFRRGQELGKQ